MTASISMDSIYRSTVEVTAVGVINRICNYLGWVGSHKTVLAGDEVVRRVWRDRCDAEAIHGVIRAVDNRIVAVARLNMYNHIEENDEAGDYLPCGLQRDVLIDALCDRGLAQDLSWSTPGPALRDTRFSRVSFQLATNVLGGGRAASHSINSITSAGFISGGCWMNPTCKFLPGSERPFSRNEG